MEADAVMRFVLFYTANASFWSPRNFHTVSPTVIQFMYVCWGHGRIRIPCVSWWHGGFADRSVLTGWNQTHRHQDTPEAQTVSSSEAVCHGTAHLRPPPLPPPPRFPLSLQSAGIYPCLGLCCEASVNMCNTRQEQNYSTHQVGFSYQCQYFSTWTDKQAEGGADGAVRASWIT